MKNQFEIASPYLFHDGTNYRAYEYFGAHRQGDEYVFRVWAPNTTAAFVTGLFNSWSESDPMEKVDDGGVWECRIGRDRFGDGYGYQFKFKSPDGDIYKCDPYAFYSELAPQIGSRFFDLSGYAWSDDTWMKARKKKYTREKISSQPLNIYELHAESWKKYGDGYYLTYKDLAEELAPYAVQMGYTHVELLPISEYPSGDWHGHEVTGYYSPTSRFGSPHDFMDFVNTMHKAGIGVIIDCAPAYFPKGPYGLCKFDGGYAYEYRKESGHDGADPKEACFDVAVPEVQSFIISNAMYWAEQFHIDGIKYGDIAAILSLDFNVADCRYSFDIYGNRGPFEAAAFFRKLNNAMLLYYPDVLMIAEDSSRRSDVTSFAGNGLGFSLNWNLKWMESTLEYASADSVFRRMICSRITEPLSYAYADKFILPFAHSQVVFGKRSLISKMPGDYDEKFSGTKAFMTYLMTQPGKKLSFMTNEIAQFDEWSHNDSVQWFLLDFDKHAKFQLFCAELNNLYLKTPALWENDGGWEGFGWIDLESCGDDIISYRRIDRSGDEVIAVFNFSSVDAKDYMMGVPFAGVYQEILSSDDTRYGGAGKKNGKVKTVGAAKHGFDQSLRITLPAYGACIFKCIRKASPN